MPSVFLSHAAADKPLATDVKTMIQTAVGLNPAEIFFSSSAGSGLTPGRNFKDQIADRLRDAGFVIAIITPAYLESQFCLAELGAVWYDADKEFYPLCIAVDYEELAATLTGVQVPRLDQRASLTGLLQALCTYAKREHVAAACTEAADSFLGTLKGRVRRLAGPSLVAAEKFEEVERQKDTLADQLTSARDELAALEERYEALEQTKDRDEAEALQPAREIREAVAEALTNAKEAVRVLDSTTIRLALPFSLKGEGMPWPDGGSYELDEVRGAVDEGYLTDGEDGRVYASTSWPKTKRALECLEEAQELLRSLDSDDEEWFTETYEVPPDLRQTAVFAALV